MKLLTANNIEFEIDDVDFDKIKSFTWFRSDRGYIQTSKNKITIMLHRFLLDCPQDKVVDHIDNNKLNNKKNNLRVCSVIQNLARRVFPKRINQSRKSEIKGVYKQCGRSSWVFITKLNRKSFYGGSFKSKEEAEKFAISWYKEVYKEFSPY